MLHSLGHALLYFSLDVLFLIQYSSSICTILIFKFDIGSLPAGVNSGFEVKTILSGLPHTWGIQGMSINFQAIENPRENQKILNF